MSQIAIRVTPRSSKPGIGGWRTGADGRDELEVRVAEAPADGSANAAVVKLLARALDLARTDVRIVSGHTSRHKRIEVPAAADEVRRRLGKGKQDG
jgi:uncharacterized protein (TIGR00251 family)